MPSRRCGRPSASAAASTSPPRRTAWTNARDQVSAVRSGQRDAVDDEPERRAELLGGREGPRPRGARTGSCCRPPRPGRKKATSTERTNSSGVSRASDGEKCRTRTPAAPALLEEVGAMGHRREHGPVRAGPYDLGRVRVEGDDDDRQRPAAALGAERASRRQGTGEDLPAPAMDPVEDPDRHDRGAEDLRGTSSTPRHTLLTGRSLPRGCASDRRPSRRRLPGARAARPAPRPAPPEAIAPAAPSGPKTAVGPVPSAGT